MHKKTRILSSLLVALFSMALVLANEPPTAEMGAAEYYVKENDYAFFVVKVEDPERSNVQVRFFSPPGMSLEFDVEEASIASGSQVRNSFVVPAGTEGSTLAVPVELEDNAGNVAEVHAYFNVTGVNHRPHPILHTRQGENDVGSVQQPFKPGGVGIELEIEDPDNGGAYSYRWGASKVSGGFCSGNLMFFGGEGPEPVVVVPKVSTLSGIAVSCEVSDGAHTVEVTRVFYVKPEATGCLLEDPLEKITAEAIPQEASYGQTISLVGDHPDRQGLNIETAWYLLGNSTGEDEVLLARDWETNYTAPSYPTTLKFKFVGAIASREVSRRVDVIVKQGSSGGGGDPPGDCPKCDSGLPPTVDAGPAVQEVIGGESLALEGSAGDPNLPPGSIPAMSARWDVVDVPAGVSVRIENAYSLKTRLLTSSVDSSVTIRLRLTVTASSTGCTCSDTILVTINPKPTVDPVVKLRYAFDSQNYKLAANGSTIRRNVSSFPVEVRLQASLEGFEDPVITWETNEPGQLTSASGEATTLQVRKSDETTATVPVSLVVSEGGDSAHSVSSTVTFVLTAPNRKAALRYSIDGRTFKEVPDGATVKYEAEALPLRISLEASVSGYSLPVYKWSTEEPGELSKTDGLTSVLEISEVEGTVDVPVTLEVSEWSQPETSQEVRVTFEIKSEQKEAQIRYSFDGNKFQTAADGSTVMHDSDSLPVEIVLDADVTGFNKPSYRWRTESPGVIASSSVKRPTLRIERASGSVAVPVSLRVEEETRSGEVVEVSMTFQLTLPESMDPPVRVGFTISTGEEAEPGALVILEGSAESANGGGLYDLIFEWSVKTAAGLPIEVLSNHNRAVFMVPAANLADSELVIELVVREGDAASEPVRKTLYVMLPTLHFAHFGVGSLGNGEELVVELILVNDSAENVVGALVKFLGQDGEPVLLEVDGSVGQSVEFSLGAGEARQLILRSPDGEVRQGWIYLCSRIRLTGVALFRYVNEATGEVKTEAALFSSKAGRRFTTAIRPGTNPDLGLAIANPTEQPVNFSIIVREAGSLQEVRAERTLGPKNQIASFLPDLFNSMPIPSEFSGGTLIIEVAEGEDGALIATMLRLRNGFLTSVPLAVKAD
jgi:hypothetical protein